MQTLFVNGRPVKSKLLTAALEEAYRNRIMSGKFPSCVLHLTLPANAVDVNVHPAKTEVKFLSEKAVFDCVHYGVLAALNKTPDRPQVQFKPSPAASPIPATPAAKPAAPKQETFFRTMTTEEFKNFSTAMKDAPQPRPAAAAATVAKLETVPAMPLREDKIVPTPAQPTPAPAPVLPPQFTTSIKKESVAPAPVPEKEPEQTVLPIPMDIPWRYVGELYNTYIIVEQGEEAFLIDKHAAHERILFDKLKANQETISSQTLLSPLPCRLSAEGAAELLANDALLDELGFEVEEFGENTLLLRRIPMDLNEADAAEVLEELAGDLLTGKQEDKSTLRDEMLHTVACKAAIKAGWTNDEKELLALVKEVMARQELKYCPHGRPICITLSKKQLERQFKRS